jgi:hypothetical protein
VSPVGFTSGSFRLLPDPNRPGRKVAVNDVANLNLWGPTGNVWDLYSKGDKEAARVFLVKKLGMSAHAAAKILLAGDRSCDGKGVPVELLIALTSIVDRAK